MYFALNPGMIGIKTDLFGAMELAKKTGFKGIATDPASIESAGVEKVSDALAENGLMNAGFGFDPYIIDKTGDEWKMALDKLAKEAGIERKCGATRCSTWILSSSNEPTDERMERFAEKMRCVALTLEAEGISCGLEFVGPLHIYRMAKYPFIRTMDEMLAMCRKIGTKKCGLLLDSYHLYTAGGEMEDVLKLKAEDIVQVHINDAVSGVARDELQDQVRLLPCETNVVDGKAFLTSLAKIGYEGPVITEPFYKPFREIDDAQKKAQMTIDAMKKAYPFA